MVLPRLPSLRRSVCLALCCSVCVAGACRSAAPRDEAAADSIAAPSDGANPAESEAAIAPQSAIPEDDTATAAAASAPAGPAPAPYRAGAIRGDALVVNDAVVQVNDVLYALRDRIAEAKRTMAGAALRAQLERWVQSQTQQEVGTILIYGKASAAFDEQRTKALDAIVKREVDSRVLREFGGSEARFEKHLAEFGVALAQYRERVKRQFVVRAHTQDLFLPQVAIRRDELMAHYRANMAKYSTPETRELWIIEAPFEKFLPGGGRWSRATTEEKSIAYLGAKQAIERARRDLTARPFEEVAREHSLGAHREAGGCFGPIARPLAPPYDAATKLIFSYQSGQTSDVIETDSGFVMVRCGTIHPGTVTPFETAQAEIRDQLREERYNKLATDYVVRLAEKASIVGFESFVRTAVDRALSDGWPAAVVRP